MVWWVLIAVGAVVVGIAVYDLVQTKHAVLRNFPVVGHLRYILEAIGPELRQYIVTDNDAEKPFSRDERRWVYTAAKQRDTYFGFGTDNDLERTPNVVIVKQSAFPLDTPPGGPGSDDRWPIPCAKVVGGPRGRTHAFRLPSIVNISNMSYGSLSARAVEALNRAAVLASVLHGTGEGGVSAHHLHGADLIWQIGTGYFGCRDEQGRFDLARFTDAIARHPVKLVEIKISQGAKPGLGGILPAAKLTREVAEIRGVPLGVDCISPARHSAFHDVDSMLDFVELLAQQTGVPVGIKSAVGDLGFFEELAGAMARDPGRGVDYVTIDGGEGGTGAGPLVFNDHVAFPFKQAFARVYRAFAEEGVTERLVFTGAGRLGLPANAAVAFALGADSVNVGREAMLAIGCIQAQRCHTNRCPTGVTTHSRRRWGLDPSDKSARCANYLVQLRKELLLLAHACGVEHPALLTPDHIDIVDTELRSQSLRDHFGYEPGWGLPSASDQNAAIAAMQADREEPRP